MTAAGAAAGLPAWRAWPERLTEEWVDYRALAVLRIAAGPLVLLHLAPFRELAAQGLTYSDVFYEPYVDWFPEVSPSSYFLFLNLAGLAAVLVSIGLLTRLATVYTAVFVGYNLLLSETHFHHNRAFLFILLAGLAAAPVGRAWSVDAALRRRRREGTPAQARRWVLTLLRFEIAMVYLASGISKLIDPDWWGGLVTQIRMERATGQILDAGIPESLLDLMLSTGFHAGAAKIIVLTELFIGVGLLVPRVRLAAVWLAIPFHVSIQLFAHVEVFSYAALAALVVWVTPVARDRRVVVRLDRRRGRAAYLMVRGLDWTGRFVVSSQCGEGPLLTLYDRPGPDGAPVVRHDAAAARMILTRLPLTFFLAAPLLLPGMGAVWDRFAANEPPTIDRPAGRGDGDLDDARQAGGEAFDRGRLRPSGHTPGQPRCRATKRMDS